MWGNMSQTTVKYYLIPIKMSNILKIQKVARVGKKEKLEMLCIVCWIARWSTFMNDSSKLQPKPLYEPSVSLWRNIHKSEKQDLKNNLHMHVFSSIIYNNEDMEVLNG